MPMLTKVNLEIIQEIEQKLKPYEQFEMKLVHDGYLITLKTNTVIHRIFTTSTLYKKHRMYVANKLIDINFKELETWLTMARLAIKKGLDDGNYTEKLYQGGEYLTIKRKFNRWFYFDDTNQKTIGKVQTCRK